MVKVINKSVCRGVAGRRSGNVKGVVIHNTADNASAEQHMNRLASYSNAQLENGFAHYFIDENTIVRTEDTYNMAWHTANADGNANYIGYEVCRSTGDINAFKQAEQNTFKQAAEDLKFYGLQPNRNTVRLHREFVATACPHRSWDIHGKSVNAVKDYFIQEIKKYMSGGNTMSKPKVKSNYWDTAGRLEVVQDVPTWNKDWSKQDKNWFFKKGSIIDTRDIVISSSGSTHAKVGMMENTFITLSKDYVKRI